MQRVAQDGVRVRAGAGGGSFHRKETLEGHLARVKAQVQRLREELHEDTQASSHRQKAAKERVARERDERLTEALRQIEEVKRVKARAKSKKLKNQPARSSSTDPDARVMKMANGGYNPAFNVQFTTDVDTQVIVGVDVTNAGSDSAQMAPMIRQIIERYGRAPEQMLVDGGFASPKAVDEVAESVPNCQVYGPVQKYKDTSRHPHQPQKGDSPSVAAWRIRMGTDEAKTIYRLRAQVAECVNALARNRGLYKFLVRGLKKVRAVTLWYAVAHNLNRSVSLARA